MRLGIFGGSFDPVHYGHLILAESCREQCRLDQVWFLPTAVAPHKQHAPPTPAADRVEMLQLAVAGHPAFRVSRLEVERGGVNYTADTLEAIREQQPDAELFFLMGGDSLHDLPGWRDPQRICQAAIPVVVHRADSPPLDFKPLEPFVDAERLERIRRHVVEMPIIQLSSTDLRQRIAEGASIRYRTPRAVEQYLAAKELYR